MDTNFPGPQEVFLSQDGTLCHVVFRRSNHSMEGRIDISIPSEFLQLASITASGGTSFRAHIHLEREVSHTNFRAQESWVVMEGRVVVDYYDDYGHPLGSAELDAGDVSISFRGGHGYKIIERSVIYEFKTGPYLGQASDKRFID